MARRHAQKEVRKAAAPKGPRQVRTDRGKRFPWWAQVAVVIAFVAVVIYAVNLMRPEEDGTETPEPEHFIREADFTAALDTDAIFILQGRNGTIDLNITNTGETFADFVIDVGYNDSLTVDLADEVSVEANRSRRVPVLVTAGDEDGNYSLSFAVSIVRANTTQVEWNGTGDNATAGNETIEVLTRNVTIDAYVWVSSYGLRFEAMSENVGAAPGENVTVVFEVENTGSLDEWVGIGVTRFEVHGNESDWDEPELDISDSIFLSPGYLTHVRMNMTVPAMANPEGDFARVLVEGHSLSAEDLEIPLFHKIWVRVNVSAFGIRAEADAYLKDVMPGRWVNYTISVVNFGGTPVNIKYHLDLIPQTWAHDLDVPPEDGWPLTSGHPITFRIGLRPDEDQLDTELILSVTVYTVDEEAESVVRLTTRVRNPSFSFFAPSDRLEVDLDVINWGVVHNRTTWSRFPMAVRNDVLFEYELQLDVVVPGGWLGTASPPAMVIGPESIAEFTLDLWLPVNTTSGEYPVMLEGVAEGLIDTLGFFAVVTPYINGTHDRVALPSELQVPHPVNGTTNATFIFQLTNTGNEGGPFDVAIDNWNEIEAYPNWSVELVHGENSSAKRLAVFVPRGSSEEVQVRVEVSDGFDPADFVARILVTVPREHIWIMEPINLHVTVG